MVSRSILLHWVRDREYNYPLLRLIVSPHLSCTALCTQQRVAIVEREEGVADELDRVAEAYSEYFAKGE